MTKERRPHTFSASATLEGAETIAQAAILSGSMVAVYSQETAPRPVKPPYELCVQVVFPDASASKDFYSQLNKAKKRQ